MTKVCGKEVELPNPKDNRAVFNYVKKALLEQNARSARLNDNGTDFCVYRIDNKACAAGHLIPDDKYDPSFEGRVVRFWHLDMPYEDGSDKTTLFFHEQGYDLKLIQRLQMIHDFDRVENWQVQLDELEQELFGKTNESHNK